ncbi:MAG TPA: hypothetical protein VGM70_06685 [Pseudolysinimonas sp.]|jgi:hypothetical protein
MSIRSVVPALAVSAASLLLLAGCASGAATPTVNPTDAINATTVMPGDFPPSVPLIDGDILTASTTNAGWVVWIKTSDPISSYGDAASALQDAGFTPSADQSINGSAGGVFTNDQFTVTVTAGSDAKYQNAVGYQVDKN